MQGDDVPQDVVILDQIEVIIELLGGIELGFAIVNFNGISVLRSKLLGY